MRKKILAIIIFVYTLTAWANLTFAQTSNTDYTKANVSSEIEKYLCAPSPPKAASTNLTGNQIEYSGANNTASGDLYNCINRLYRFAIVVAAVVGVFFIVIAGYLYMSAGGNQEGVDKAKSILETTITSLVILFAGYILLKAINPDLVLFKSIQPPSVVLTKAIAPENIGDLAVTDFNIQTFDNTTVKPTQIGSCPAGGTNTGGFQRFSQCNGSWANVAYGSCDTSKYGPSTIGTSGCGPTSMANAIKYWQGQNKVTVSAGAPTDVNPQTIAALSVQKGFRICGQGTSRAMFSSVASLYGLKATQVGWTQALDAIKQNKPVIGAMGPGLFTSGGHFVVFYGLSSDGKVLVADSGPRNITQADQSIVAGQAATFFIIQP